MSKFILVILFYIPCTCGAQLYIDASDNLPDNGAKGSSMDVRAADLDGDGDLDIVLANEFQANTILSNNGNGVFTNTTIGNLPQAIHDSEDVAIADFNNDGHLDLIFCSEDDTTIGWLNVHEYYLGDGTGSFSNANYQFPDSEANAVITEDINGDNFPDVLFGNNGGTGVFINNGDGSFTQENDRVPQINRTTQDLNMADVDGDGDLDLFEGNENGNLLHINDGSGHFTDESLSRLPQGLNIETRKVSFGDIDGDNDLDIFLSNVVLIPGKNPQNRLYINDGNGNFADVSLTQLPVDNDLTIDGIFEDIDQDGDLDIIVANVFGAHLKIYQNDGSGIFVDGTSTLLGENYTRDALGVIAVDLNGDTLNDIYVCDRKMQNSNNKDLLLIKESIINSQNNLGFQNLDIIVTPNPGKDSFTIQFENTVPESILITNSNGGLIKSIRTISDDLISIDLSKFPAGVYLVIAQHKNEQRVIKKLIKE